jgi:hypothetical protein
LLRPHGDSRGTAPINASLPSYSPLS